MNLQDYRIDIKGQDWSANRRFDGDYIRWKHVEPIISQHAQMLEALNAQQVRVLQALKKVTDWAMELEEMRYGLTRDQMQWRYQPEIFDALTLINKFQSETL